MPFVQSADAAIYWKLEGEDGAPPLVLLNSIGCDMDLWAPALAGLRRRFALLRIDTRGHGASSAPPGDYSLPGLAADILAVMDAAGVQSAAIAGVSLGGMIAMQLALSAPERVNGLALICTSAAMDRAAWTARVETVRSEGLEGILDLAMSRFLSPDWAIAHPDLTATVRRGLRLMAPSGYAGCAAAIRDMDLASHIASLRTPTLVITGAKDSSTPLEGHGDRLLATIPRARHIHLDAAHLAPLEAPQALTAAIIDTLA